MKLLRSLICLIFAGVLCVGFGVGCSNKCDAIPMQSRILATAESNNPYEDPGDPNTTSKGTTFSVGTMTGYFMDIDWDGKKISMGRPCDLAGTYRDLYKRNSVKQVEVTALLTFTEITYNDRPVFVSVPATIETYGNALPTVFHEFRCKFLNSVSEQDGTSIRLPASYYNYLKYEEDTHGKSIGKFKIIFVWNGNKSLDLQYTYTFNCRLYTKDIPADSDDPTSPNFDLGSWSGVMAVVKNGFDWRILIYVGIAIAALFVIGLFVNLFRWIFRK